MDEEAIATQLMDAKGWDADTHADVLERVRHALQRAQKDGPVDLISWWKFNLSHGAARK
jgi:hypothetical protein